MQTRILRSSGALLLGLVAAFAGCTNAPEPTWQEPIPPETVERARTLASSFKGELKRALMEGLADGPTQAIGACSIVAPELAAELSTDGARVGRTSHKLRNPANRGTDWVLPLLEEFRRSAPGAQPKVVRVDESTVGYVEPLYVGKPCLTCHGEAVAEEVLAEIRAVYPEDTATGFREGDLRGVLWVEIR